MPTLNVSLIQMDIKRGNPRLNWPRAQTFLSQAKQQGAQLAILPELWDAGFALKQAKEFASSLSGGLFAQLAALSKQLDLFITGSMLEKRGLGVANCAPMVSPTSGIVGAYRKAHLFRPMQEDQYLTAGEGTVNLNLPWGQTALAICYDLRFPELFRRYAVEGAKVILLPCQWPEPRLEHYRTLLRARAIENGVFIVAVNRVGGDVDEETGQETRYFGHSSVIDPFGNLVLEAGAEEGLYNVRFDLALCEKAQKAIPVLEDRRPELYGY